MNNLENISLTSEKAVMKALIKKNIYTYPAPNRRGLRDEQPSLDGIQRLTDIHSKST